MCFIYIQPVYAQLFEGDHIILAFFRLQLFQACFQLLLCAYQLFDGKLLAIIALQLFDAQHNLIDLCINKPLLTFQ